MNNRFLTWKTGIAGAAFVMMIAAGGTAFADESAPAAGSPGARYKAALQGCATSLGITLPIAKGDRATRQKLHACLKEQGISFGPKFRHEMFEKIQACASSQGVTLPQPTPGERPQLSDAQKAVIKTCRKQVMQQLRAAHQNGGSASAQSPSSQ